MNHFFKKVIEETFASKKQQKFFYAKASDKSIPKKERKKWGKWASEFSSKTDFDKVREYYYNKFKIHYRLTTIDTKRSPVYYVLDENDTTNFNDY